MPGNLLCMEEKWPKGQHGFLMVPPACRGPERKSTGRLGTRRPDAEAGGGAWEWHGT